MKKEHPMLVMRQRNEHDICGMFFFVLGMTMWSHNILNEYAGIIGKIELVVASLATTQELKRLD